MIPVRYEHNLQELSRVATKGQAERDQGGARVALCVLSVVRKCVCVSMFVVISEFFNCVGGYQSSKIIISSSV